MRGLSERGDTLVEVTMALAILALVLTGAFAVANKAFNLGQSAKERSQMVADAQQQAEALQSFRDSHNWNEFVAGNAVTGLPGITVLAGSVDCDAATLGVQHCFHMVQQVVGGLNQWVPAAGPGTDSQIAGQGFVRIMVDGAFVAAPLPQSYTFAVQYGVPPRGGGPTLTSNLHVVLTDLDRLRS